MDWLHLDDLLSKTTRMGTRWTACPEQVEE
jgi:hypothetical protein